MKEIEVKILDIDLKQMLAKLQKLGAKKTFEGTLFAGGYDTPTRQIAAQNKMLRIRTEEKKRRSDIETFYQK